MSCLPFALPLFRLGLHLIHTRDNYAALQLPAPSNNDVTIKIAT